MKTTPKPCNCNNCECAIYTYEDSGLCIACNDGKHSSGAIKKIYEEEKEPKLTP